MDGYGARDWQYLPSMNVKRVDAVCEAMNEGIILTGGHTEVSWGENMFLDVD